MPDFAAPVERLIDELKHLPGIGQKTAQRLAFYLLRSSREDALGLADAIRDAKEKIRTCSTCNNITDIDPCLYCAGPSRSKSTICVVEEAHNIMAIEKTRQYGGLYHVLVNSWSDRKAFHLTSVDGITDWKYQGLAYDPARDFIRYTDGTVNHWNKLERPGVYLENGHVVAVTLAAIDVPKDDAKGNSGHGSKIIVVPFDGAALDADLQKEIKSQN